VTGVDDVEPGLQSGPGIHLFAAQLPVVVAVGLFEPIRQRRAAALACLLLLRGRADT
jgi:hypothetical protein